MALLKRAGGLLLATSAFAVALPVGLSASIDPSDGAAAAPDLRMWTLAQTTSPPAEAIVPPVRREAPKTPEPEPQDPPAAAPQATEPASAAKEPITQYAAPPPGFAGVFGAIQEWLARANREYQNIVVKQLSMPPAGKPAEDEIAKKLKEQEAEDKHAAKQAKAEAAAKAKQDDTQASDADSKRAEETKRLADEAKKNADEVLNAPAPAAAPKPDDAARIAEQQRAEAQKLADEVRRQDQARKAEEARRAEDERKRIEAARSADERRRAAEAEEAAVKHRTRTVVLVPEPINRPLDRGTVFRPELSTAASRSLVHLAQTNGARLGAYEPRRQIRFYSEARRIAHRGTAVKRWVWRAGGTACRAAGRRITPPGRYTIRRGDSLWRISQRHYNTGRQYKKIYRANRASISDPDLIYPCQRVLVPRRR